MPHVIPQDLEKAAVRGEPSHVWRAGQERRFAMLKNAAGARLQGSVLVDGCGVGTYLARLVPVSGFATGIDIEYPRVVESSAFTLNVLCAAGEYLPYRSESMDLVFSHEVLEHVQDDAMAISEMVRVLKPGGRIVLFCPNRGYPFETHGLFWKGKYHFGNKLFVNYLPNVWRNRLAPHVKVYTRRDLENLFAGLPVKYIQRTVIFGGYDNIIARSPSLGKLIRGFLYAIEKTFLRVFGLSHFWIVEKI